MFWRGDRVVALCDAPPTAPFEIAIVKGAIYEVAAVDNDHGAIKVKGDRVGRWLSALYFGPMRALGDDPSLPEAGPEVSAREIPTA